MSQIRLSLPHPQSLPLLQHKRIKISQKQLLKPKSFPHPQPEEQEFWQFVAAKSLMGNTPFLITVYSMHYQENVSFLVKKFCESGKCRKFPEENNRIAGFRCEYFIKNRVKKHFS